MPGGFLTSEGYRCYEVGTENEIVILDDRENKEPKFVEGDTITVYGTYYGTEKMERLLTGEKVSVRQIPICIILFIISPRNYSVSPLAYDMHVHVS